MLIVLLVFAVWAVVRTRAGLLDALRQIAPGMVVSAFVPAYLALVISLFVWRALMTDLGFRLPVPAAAKIFYLSQLGKYVPGSVWSILSQVELSREHNIPKRSNIAVGVLAIAVSITSGLTIAALLLPFSGARTIHHYWWILLLIPVLLALLHPAILGPLLNFGLRLIRRDPLPRTPSWVGLGKVVCLQCGVWLMLGLQAWLLLVGLGAPAARSLPIAIGGYALAYGLGQLVVGVPAGAGVREAALTVALATVVTQPEALIVALLSRGMLTVVDLSLAGLQYLLGMRKR
jgi:uncharacterized membrane protein YbhN (UPF0104 family)